MDEHEIGAQAGGDPAAVGEAEDARRGGGGGPERLDRRQAGPDQQGQLAEQAGAGDEADVADVGTSEDRLAIGRHHPGCRAPPGIVGGPP